MKIHVLQHLKYHKIPLQVPHFTFILPLLTSHSNKYSKWYIYLTSVRKKSLTIFQGLVLAVFFSKVINYLNKNLNSMTFVCFATFQAWKFQGSNSRIFLQYAWTHLNGQTACDK